ncbi:MAG TPA: peptidoglycan editing factor PgeF [Rhizobiaceae bacterium]|nr:peptidoglycan editing factor PgeF [Rhizobiaceae bacterium]
MTNDTLPRPVRSPAFDDAIGGGRLQYGFFGRSGGVSQGLFAGLNAGLGSGDERESVVENRRRIAAALGVKDSRLVTPYQVHSPDVAVVDGPFAGERPKVDAVVTSTPGLAIGVVTADCGPVLFADTSVRVIGAAHAGWRGALTGILENTVAAMEALGASRRNIAAVLGPTISVGNYEVDAGFHARFVEQDAANARFFAPSDRPGHFRFDLPAYILARLDKAGIAATTTGQCTYGDEENWFSFRRTTHRAEPDYGRQMSAIALQE